MEGADPGRFRAAEAGRTDAEAGRLADPGRLALRKNGTMCWLPRSFAGLCVS
eukprot:SAG31_NODE_1421_length_8423_cov_2.477054_7_plen_52_part_00